MHRSPSVASSLAFRSAVLARTCTIVSRSPKAGRWFYPQGYMLSSSRHSLTTRQGTQQQRSERLTIRPLRSTPVTPVHIHKASGAASSTSVRAMSHSHVLVSFDVDGTLIHSVGDHANKLHKEAFAAGFKQVFDIDTHIDVIAHHGSTDPLVVIKVMEHHGVAKETVVEALPKVKDVMNHHFTSNATSAAEGIEILPGVKALLEALQGTGQVATCLVTGNLEPIGWTKMQALGIDHLFTQPKFGGFGSDFCSGNTDETWRDRAELVRIAATKGLESVPGASGWKARFHVGDTPMDIQAALDAGAVAIGVTTGIFTAEQLRAAAPAGSEASGQLVLLEGLQDTQALLKAIGVAA